MKTEERFMLVAMMWFLAVIALVGIFISAGLMSAFTLAHWVFGGIILAIAISATPILLYVTRPQDTMTKAKRQKIDTMLRDMSDDELIELKQRLVDGDVSEESLLDYISDDGELVYRNS